MVKIGIVGLGRLGKNHAINISRTNNCSLTAACSVIQEELDWAKQQFPTITPYTSYDKMLEKADIDAVFLVTTTKFHATQIMKGFEAGKHVFCEKPLAIDVATARSIMNALEEYEKKYTFMLGFVRRFDPAHMYAKKRIDEGIIGEPFMVYSQTADHNDFAPFQVTFTPQAGGIFHDMNVHDIDLARWFLSSEIQTVYATGGAFVHKEFETINDADNTVVNCQCNSGKIAIISASRTSFYGHDTRIEIIGSKGRIRIGYTPANADIDILDTQGMRKECVYTFYDRFEQGFKNEVQIFVDCIMQNKASPVTAKDSLLPSIVAEAFTLSFKEKRVVSVDEV